MILVDSRVGSINVVRDIVRHGVPCEVTTLESGDFAFEGKGPRDTTVHVGIERKEIRDLASCMVDHRFAHKQAPKMQATYDRCYLIVEGQWRPGPDGELQLFTRGQWTSAFKGPRGIKYVNVFNYLMSIGEFSKFRVVHSYNMDMTAAQVANLYRFWSKRYEAHTSHGAVYHEPLVMVPSPSFERTVASTMPGIGTKLSGEVVRRFSTVYNMATGSAAMWASIPGVGAVKASRIYNAIRGFRR